MFDGPDRVIAVSRKRRFIGALRRAIEVRDRRCQHPSGCDEPAVVSLDGFDEVLVPVHVGTVRYEASNIFVGLSSAPSGARLNAEAVAYTMPGGTGDVEPLPDGRGWRSGTLMGQDVAVVSVDETTVATIGGSDDVGALADQVRLVPAADVEIAASSRPPDVPADARRSVGETSRGRWQAFEYSSPDGLDCISLETSWSGGGGRCGGADGGPLALGRVHGGLGIPIEVSVFVAGPADSVDVMLDDVPIDVTVERSQDYTFAEGPAPTAAVARIAVAVDGRQVC